MATHVEKTDKQWREELTPDQYDVLRKGATERAFTGKYWDAHEDGIYRCAGCGAELFMSEKTASVHVSRILSKLGVGGRVEAAAVAHRLGLTETAASV